MRSGIVSGSKIAEIPKEFLEKNRKEERRSKAFNTPALLLISNIIVTISISLNPQILETIDFSFDKRQKATNFAVIVVIVVAGDEEFAVRV